MKEIRFINKPALKEFKLFPDHIKKRFANDLNAIGQNKNPFYKIKHLTDSVGIGAVELIENGRPAYRTVYVAKYKNTIFVLHSFTKTTKDVEKKAMATVKKRYKLMKEEIK